MMSLGFRVWSSLNPDPIFPWLQGESFQSGYPHRRRACEQPLDPLFDANLATRSVCFLHARPTRPMFPREAGASYAGDLLSEGLNFDHIGAEVGQDSGGERTGDELAKLNNTQARQGKGAHKEWIDQNLAKHHHKRCARNATVSERISCAMSWRRETGILGREDNTLSATSPRPSSLKATPAPETSGSAASA